MSLYDCFQAPDQLITLDQALRFLAERLSPVVGVERVALADACGRVLAEDVVAGTNSPPFASAAMDGFAVRSADLADAGPDRAFRVVARIAAGHPVQRSFGSGEAARIFTGAPLPEDLDTVVMQEDCRVSQDGPDELLRLPVGVVPGSHVRRAGDDFPAGAVVLRGGRRLRPQDVAMAASVGRPSLAVRQQLRVGILSTGDEVIEPGRPLPPGAIYSCNRFALMSLAGGLGAAVTDLGNLPDSLDATRDALAEAGERFDLLVTSGGMSVGGEDHVRSAVEAVGDIHFWRMAVKPGKPTALGHVGRAAFAGLSGYPVSAQVTFMMFVRPIIHRLSGAIGEPLAPWRFPVPAAFAFEKNQARRQFVRARLRAGSDGRPEAILFRSQEPNSMSSLVDTDGLVDLSEDLRQVSPGDIVQFIPYQTIQW